MFVRRPCPSCENETAQVQVNEADFGDDELICQDCGHRWMEATP
jgi:DNA-directed RNA polymerase subunit M/transcription elongation factor TFIIS